MHGGSVYQSPAGSALLVGKMQQPDLPLVPQDHTLLICPSLPLLTKACGFAKF